MLIELNFIFTIARLSKASCINADAFHINDRFLKASWLLFHLILRFYETLIKYNFDLTSKVF